MFISSGIVVYIEVPTQFSSNHIQLVKRGLSCTISDSDCLVFISSYFSAFQPIACKLDQAPLSAPKSMPVQNAIAEKRISSSVLPHPLSHNLVGLKGLLNPPTRFMYCRYSVFLSFLTPYNLSFPGTFVFLVLLKPTKPITLFIAVSSSSLGSIT